MWSQGDTRQARAGMGGCALTARLRASPRRSSPACLPQLLLLLLLLLGLVVCVKGGALPSLFGASSSSSTSATDKPGLPPLVWFAPFYSGGGYCSEAIAFMQALQMTAPHNQVVAIQQHGDSYSPSFLQGLDRDTIMMMMELNEAWSEVDVREAVVVCHSEPGAWHPPKYITSMCPPSGSLYRVGRTMFETDRLPSGWHTRLNAMDEVWVPTSFHAHIFTQGGVIASKLVVVGEGVDTEAFSPHSPIPPYPLPHHTTITTTAKGAKDKSKRPFVFLSVFKWELRKGYDVLLKAYLSEFLPPLQLQLQQEEKGEGPTASDSDSDDVTLVLLTNAYHDTGDFESKVRSLVVQAFPHTDTPGHRHWPQDFPRITVLSGLSSRELVGLYKSCDVLVMPSRGEGWGRPHVEAMASAKPVIATNWSGPTEFINDSNGYLLRYDGLEDITEGPFRGHKWAAPSQAHLQQLLRHTYTHPEECVAKGQAARASMETHYSLPVMGRTLMQHLARIQHKVGNRTRGGVQAGEGEVEL